MVAATGEDIAWDSARRRAWPFVIAAAGVTLLLFNLMQILIHQDAAIVEQDHRRVADIVMEDVEIRTNLDDRLPEKPEQAEDEPAEPELAEIEPLEFDQEFDTGLGGVRVGLGKGFSADGEYLPIVKVAPIYPRSAQTRGLEGYCIVRYVVTTVGSVRDPEVVDCSSRIFERASMRAALKFKYKPRVIDGEAVEVKGVLNRFTYELED